MRQAKLAIIIISTIAITIRLAVASLLITASYELDTYALRLLAICSGLWIIVLAIRRAYIFAKGYKKIFAQSE